MTKFQEELKNKRRSISKVGVEAILDDMEFSRIMRQEIAESFIRTNLNDDEENIDYKN